VKNVLHLIKVQEEFEPDERNPMIGWRGESRYINPKYEPAFRLEVRAIKKAREEMGLRNIWVMLPFVRTTWEVERVLKIMEEEGLKRSSDFKIWIMAEVPSVVLLAEDFAKIIDGFSIGSNDLAQLTLGVDRDSELLANMGYYDERDPAVLKSMKVLIRAAHKYGKTVSICGQAPSVYPEVVEFLVREGIDSISVNPDTVIQTRRLVASIEQKIMLENSRIYDKNKKLKNLNF
jgi:pyruvate,water dikinase